MGNESSIVGPSKPEFTKIEKEIVESVNGLYETFWRQATQDNFDTIMIADTTLQKSGEPHTLFKWKARANWNLDPPLSDQEASELQSRETYLLDPDATGITAENLDCLWSLYAATGNRDYAERVLNISLDDRQHPVVRAAASWSYKAHSHQGLFDD
jgi:hypothetical protein